MSETQKILKALIDILQIEARANPELDKRISSALKSAMGISSEEPPFNPRYVLEHEGQSMLEQRLKLMTIKDLKQLINHFQIAPEGLARTAKKGDIITHIMEHADQIQVRGSVFKDEKLF